MRVQPGTTVRWHGASGGYYFTIYGEVLAFLPAGESLAPFAVGYAKSRVHIKPSTYQSRVDRYVVRVSSGALPHLYAPMASSVERDNPTLASQPTSPEPA